jgi:nitrite reductase/ring-hydroxylating ferredoxin subunit
MSSNNTAGLDAGRLVDLEHGLVSRRLFSDPEIYRLEVERIFGRCWLYLAHESQIPNVGDFVNVTMGRESVIVCRTPDGKISALINSCRHRGNKVCRADTGNAKSFLCTYHGWTYDTTGALIGLPGHRELYHDELDRSKWGLVRVAQVDSYNGMIFGTFAPDAPTLDEYLGDMRWGLDLLFAQGDLVAVPGIARWRMSVNWKFASDNAIGDMYHGMTHISAFLAGHTTGNGVVLDKVSTLHPGTGFTMVFEYGHGFNADYLNTEGSAASALPAKWRANAAIQQTLGSLRSRVNRSNMLVFPNLFVNSGSRELMLRNPLGPASMEICKTILVDKNSSEAERRANVRASNRHFGPAGMFEQDDGENWDQSTRGTSGPIAQPYDLNYSMGLGHGILAFEDDSPPRIDTLTNEHAQLWMYRCWRDYIMAESWPDLRANHSRPTESL